VRKRNKPFGPKPKFAFEERVRASWSRIPRNRPSSLCLCLLYQTFSGTKVFVQILFYLPDFLVQFFWYKFFFWYKAFGFAQCSTKLRVDSKFLIHRPAPVATRNYGRPRDEWSGL
jgi:hypothetical protein